MFEIILSIVGGLILIISYFLNRTISKLDQVEKDVLQNRLDVSVLTNDHTNKYSHLVDKFDTLAKSIDILTNKIDSLNIKLEELNRS